MQHWYGGKTRVGCDVTYLYERTTDVNTICRIAPVRDCIVIKTKRIFSIVYVVVLESGELSTGLDLYSVSNSI